MTEHVLQKLKESYFCPKRIKKMSWEDLVSLKEKYKYFLEQGMSCSQAQRHAGFYNDTDVRKCVVSFPDIQKIYRERRIYKTFKDRIDSYSILSC